MDLVNISLGSAGLIALIGYLVDFLGIVLLMIVIFIMVKIMAGTNKKKASEAVAEKAAPVAPVQEVKKAEPAKGTAGELKLYDTDPRDAAMIMAIVADNLGKPLNELRFLSIKEVK